MAGGGNPLSWFTGFRSSASPQPQPQQQQPRPRPSPSRLTGTAHPSSTTTTSNPHNAQRREEDSQPNEQRQYRPPHAPPPVIPTGPAAGPSADPGPRWASQADSVRNTSQSAAFSAQHPQAQARQANRWIHPTKVGAWRTNNQRGGGHGSHGSHGGHGGHGGHGAPGGGGARSGMIGGPPAAKPQASGNGQTEPWRPHSHHSQQPHHPRPPSIPPNRLSDPPRSMNPNPRPPTRDPPTHLLPLPQPKAPLANSNPWPPHPNPPSRSSSSSSASVPLSSLPRNPVASTSTAILPPTAPPLQSRPRPQQPQQPQHQQLTQARNIFSANSPSPYEMTEEEKDLEALNRGTELPSPSRRLLLEDEERAAISRSPTTRSTPSVVGPFTVPATVNKSNLTRPSRLPPPTPTATPTPLVPVASTSASTSSHNPPPASNPTRDLPSRMEIVEDPNLREVLVLPMNCRGETADAERNRKAFRKDEIKKRSGEGKIVFQSEFTATEFIMHYEEDSPASPTPPAPAILPRQPNPPPSVRQPVPMEDIKPTLTQNEDDDEYDMLIDDDELNGRDMEPMRPPLSMDHFPVRLRESRYDSEETKNIVDVFLRSFFKNFDEDRARLVGYYANDARFRLTICQNSPPLLHGGTLIPFSRAYFHSDRETFNTPFPIIGAIRTLPTGEHNVDKMIIDASILPSIQAVRKGKPAIKVMIEGDFDEFPSHIKRRFMRTLVLIPKPLAAGNSTLAHSIIVDQVFFLHHPEAMEVVDQFENIQTPAAVTAAVAALAAGSTSASTTASISTAAPAPASAPARVEQSQQARSKRPNTAEEDDSDDDAIIIQEMRPAKRPTTATRATVNTSVPTTSARTSGSNVASTSTASPAAPAPVRRALISEKGKQRAIPAPKQAAASPSTATASPSSSTAPTATPASAHSLAVAASQSTNTASAIETRLGVSLSGSVDDDEALMDRLFSNPSFADRLARLAAAQGMAAPAPPHPNPPLQQRPQSPPASNGMRDSSPEEAPMPRVPRYQPIRAGATSATTHGGNGRSAKLRYLVDTGLNLLAVSLTGDVVKWDTKQPVTKVVNHGSLLDKVDNFVYSAEHDALIVGVYGLKKDDGEQHIPTWPIVLHENWKDARMTTPKSTPLTMNPHHSGGVTAVTLVPSLSKLRWATGGQDKNIYLWTRESTGAITTKAIASEHTSTITCMSYLKRQKWLTSGGADRRALLYDIKQHSVVWRKNLAGAVVDASAVPWEESMFLTRTRTSSNQFGLYDSRQSADGAPSLSFGFTPPPPQSGTRGDKNLGQYLRGSWLNDTKLYAFPDGRAGINLFDMRFLNQDQPTQSMPGKAGSTVSHTLFRSSSELVLLGAQEFTIVRLY